MLHIEFLSQFVVVWLYIVILRGHICCRYLRLGCVHKVYCVKMHTMEKMYRQSFTGRHTNIPTHNE